MLGRRGLDRVDDGDSRGALDGVRQMLGDVDPDRALAESGRNGRIGGRKLFTRERDCGACAPIKTDPGAQLAGSGVSGVREQARRRRAVVPAGERRLTVPARPRIYLTRGPDPGRIDVTTKTLEHPR